MVRRGLSIGLVLLVLSALLVAVPLTAPLARAGPSVGVVFADEGDEDNGNGDEDNQDGDDPGKIAIYWPGRTIYFADEPDGYNGDPDEVAQEVLDRGFTHVVNRSYTMDDPKAAWFSERGFKVIQDATPTGDLQPMTPRYHSPYEDPDTYAAKLVNLETYLMMHSDYLVGIDDDLEYYAWPTRVYEANGQERLYPRKELIVNTPDDYEHRIGTEDAGTTWRTFKDHPTDGYHNVENLTIEEIEYNFPQPSTSHAVHNSRLNLGYFPESSGIPVGKIAQTFRPAHDRITRIDILVARHGDNNEFPLGQIHFYLTETTDGKPDESKRLFEVDLRIKQTETDFDAVGDFGEIAPLSLYFDPEEHGTLDTSKTYALVLWFRGQGSDSRYYTVAADNTDGYSDGAAFRGGAPGQWLPFENTDIWFKVYYPEPPEGWGLREFHEDWLDFQSDTMAWHLAEYRRILDRVNAAKGTSLELYVYSIYSMPLIDYTNRAVGNMHGDYTSGTYYTSDWSKFAAAGLDYAVAGWGTQDISATLAELDGRAGLICLGQNQEQFTDRWWTCNKKVAFIYASAKGSYGDDPWAVVPRGRSPKSLD